MSYTFSREAQAELKGHKMPTITPSNKHILEEQFMNLTKADFDEFLNDYDGNPKTVLGTVYENIDTESQKIFIEVAKDEYITRGFINEAKESLIDPREKYNNAIDEDVETSLLEAIKGSDILEKSLFTQSKMLDRLEETADIPRVIIEAHLEKPEIINEHQAVNNLFYTQVQEALKIINPVQKPEIKIDMTESVIWSTIRENEDWLLESKLKTYLQAKSNEYQSLSTAEKSVKKEIYPDKIHELNKLQKLIYKRNKRYPDMNVLSAKMDEGLERYKDIQAQFDIPVPMDNSLLSLYIRAMELQESKEIQNLIEHAQAYLGEQAPNKPVEYGSIFDYKSIIQNDITESAHKESTPELAWLKDYSIILKETKECFYFNIISEPFIKGHSSNLPKEQEELYETDLLKSKKTLQRQYPGKKFTKSLNEAGSVQQIDTNNWRIHLYEDPKQEKNITYNIEYYPPEYKKSDLTETETLYGIQESKTAKQLEKYLLSGEHIFIPDTGVVLWWSASDKVFMIDMEKTTWAELWKLYKQEEKRGSFEESTYSTLA